MSLDRDPMQGVVKGDTVYVIHSHAPRRPWKVGRMVDTRQHTDRLGGEPWVMVEPVTVMGNGPKQFRYEGAHGETQIEQSAIRAAFTRSLAYAFENTYRGRFIVTEADLEDAIEFAVEEVRNDVMMFRKPAKFYAEAFNEQKQAWHEEGKPVGVQTGYCYAGEGYAPDYAVIG